MDMKRWGQVVLLGILIGVMGVPSGTFTALARQQQGPGAAPPTQQPAPPKPPSGQQQGGQPQQAPPPQVAISVEANVVNVDAVVTDQDGNIITDLKKENFRILDGTTPQQVTNFAPSDAPMTIVILMEFSNKSYGFWPGGFGYKAKDWAYGFLNQLTDKDWVAFKTFDMNTTLHVDFTHNRQEVAQAITSLYFPGFSEANLFDATFETLDQLRDVKGKKSILIIATGYDTFSKHTLDQMYRRLKESDVPLFCVGIGEEIDLYRNAPISYLQAKNQLTQFAAMTGGNAWFPRFQGEMGGIFTSIAAFLRNQYTLGFTPSTPQDGRYHKIKVEIIDKQGNPLMVADKKGKMKKVNVYARQGYMAPNGTSGD